MRQWRTDDTELHTSAYVRDRSLDGCEETLDAFLLVRLVFVGAGGEFFPWFVGFASGGVDVDDVLALGTEGFVEDGGDEE